MGDINVMNRSSKRIKVGVSAALALTMLLAACGADDADPGDDVDEVQDDDPATGEDDGAEDEEAAPDGDLEPVTIRVSGDFPPPPFNTAMAIEWFKDEVERDIPGSEVRTFYGGALYGSEAEALEAASAGNLEVVFGQFGKAASFDALHGVIAQPATLQTVGAIANIGETETATMLRERMADRGITTIDYASISFFVGVGSDLGQHPTAPEDLAGVRIRTFDPLIQPVVLSSWDANPVAMAFADVPAALETGTIDGLLTSIGGWASVAEQAPYYTSWGIGAMGADPYMISASTQWLDSLNDDTREYVINKIEEMSDLSLQLTWCEDQKRLEDDGAASPNDEGIYVLSAEDAEPFFADLGDSVQEALKADLPEEAHEWVDRVAEESRELTEAHPEGSSQYEQADCAPYVEEFLS